MTGKFMNALSLNENYLCAAMLYLGLGLAVLAVAPGLPVAGAAGDECGGCEEGQICIKTLVEGYPVYECGCAQ